MEVKHLEIAWQHTIDLAVKATGEREYQMALQALQLSANIATTGIQLEQAIASTKSLISADPFGQHEDDDDNDEDGEEGEHDHAI